MKTKLNFTVIVVTILLVAVACSPKTSFSPILDPAQPEERNYQRVPLVPVTGEQRYGSEESFVAHPLRQFHGACTSENIQRQALCEEPEPKLILRSIFYTGNANADNEAYPSQKLHGACVSENTQRQERCE